MIVALFVSKDGPYFGLDGVDPWDEERDARLYPGPHAVIAHPPCARWCMLAHIVQARNGYRIGDDGGSFKSALASVRRWGGVLEHPASSMAFAAYGLPRPPRAGWQRTFCGGWVCHVEQYAYGHPAKKATWLYMRGGEPPKMRWQRAGADAGDVIVGPGHSRDGRKKLEGAASSATPAEFRDVLIAIARGCASG